MMKPLFTLNAEGGPLLLCDASEARAWSGADGADYEQLCAAFDANPAAQGVRWSVQGGQAIAWEMNGPGTAHVFSRDAGGLVVLRAWVDDDTPATFQKLADAASAQPVSIGRLEVPGGRLAILWAAESGADIPDRSTQAIERLEAGTAIDGSVYIVRTESKAFDCLHDEVSFESARARRLTLVPS